MVTSVMQCHIFVFQICFVPLPRNGLFSVAESQQVNEAAGVDVGNEQRHGSLHVSARILRRPL